MAALWPDTIVEEANLAFQISALRKVLDDGGNGESLIQTVPTRGYRFVAPVTTVGSAARLQASRRLLFAHPGIAALAVVGAGALIILLVSALRLPRPAPAPVLTKLTASPPEGPVVRAEISPDGRYLAYSDRTGVKVQTIDSGDVQAFPESRGMIVLGWNGDGTNIRVLGAPPDRRVWDVSVVGNVRRWTGLMWPDPDGMSIGPDGSCLRLMPDGELRLNPAQGASRLVGHIDNDWIRRAVWAPDAKRVFFLRGDRPPGLETLAVGSGGPSVVFSPPRGQYIRVMGAPGRDGRLIAFMGRRANPAVSVWEIQTDPVTGLLVGEPRQLTDWRELGCDQVSSSADGRRVALLTVTHQQHVYVAGFDQQAARIDTPRQLTASEFDDFPTAWTADNKSIIFVRHGQQTNIYRQDIDGTEPTLLVTSPEDKGFARVSGDGRWLLFRQLGSLTSAAPGWRVMRASIEGGPAEEVYAGVGDPWPQCSISSGCIVFDQHHGDRSIISSLDPVQGKGAVPRNHSAQPRRLRPAQRDGARLLPAVGESDPGHLLSRYAFKRHRGTGCERSRQPGSAGRWLGMAVDQSHH